jgi:flavin reductase (DIM6/NTAB) family NADH-FMN oxidoreductase RutF
MVMSRRPIDPGIAPGTRPEDGEGGGEPGVSSELFRRALSLLPSAVAVVAVRDPDDEGVYATTVGSLSSLSAEPPRISFSLGPGAQVLPFLPERRRFCVNVLTTDQRALATRFTDAFPVGPSPFSEGDPSIAGSHLVLVAVVERVVAVDDVRIVIGRIVEADDAGADEPLLYYRRNYRSLG